MVFVDFQDKYWFYITLIRNYQVQLVIQLKYHNKKSPKWETSELYLLCDLEDSGALKRSSLSRKIHKIPGDPYRSPNIIG